MFPRNRNLVSPCTGEKIQNGKRISIIVVRKGRLLSPSLTCKRGQSRKLADRRLHPLRHCPVHDPFSRVLFYSPSATRCFPSRFFPLQFCFPNYAVARFRKILKLNIPHGWKQFKPPLTFHRPDEGTIDTRRAQRGST